MKSLSLALLVASFLSPLCRAQSTPDNKDQVGTTKAIAPSGDLTPENQSETQDALKNDSEVGIVVVNGNSKNQTYNIAHKSSYAWPLDIVKLDFRFLKASSRGVRSAESFAIGLRYERVLTEQFSLFGAQNLESDLFQGYKQRYNSDFGGKYYFIKDAAHKPEDRNLNFFAETGYRFSHENYLSSVGNNYHSLRTYLEIEKYVSRAASLRYWLELLPNFSNSNALLINSELSLNAAINEIFSVKTAFLVNYSQAPRPGAAAKTDTLLTTSLVAKF